MSSPDCFTRRCFSYESSDTTRRVYDEAAFFSALAPVWRLLLRGVRQSPDGRHISKFVRSAKVVGSIHSLRMPLSFPRRDLQGAPEVWLCGKSARSTYLRCEGTNRQRKHVLRWNARLQNPSLWLTKGVLQPQYYISMRCIIPTLPNRDIA